MASLHAKTTPPSRRNKLPLDTPKRCFHEVMHPVTAHVSNTPPPKYQSRILLCLFPRRLLFRLLLPLVEHLSALKDGKSPAFLCSCWRYRLWCLFLSSAVFSPPLTLALLCAYVSPTKQSSVVCARVLYRTYVLFSVFRVSYILFSVCRSIGVRIS